MPPEISPAGVPTVEASPGRGPGRGTVLAIEDDPDVRRLLLTLLSGDGYLVQESATAREGLRTFHETRPDVVILDLVLPDLDGWEVLSRIRDMSDVPVLVLSGCSAEAERVRGLSTGADDYLSKPFSHAELLARINAVRRRVPPPSAGRAGFDDGHLRVDFVSYRAFLDGVVVPLTPIEYRLLSALVRHAGEVLSADRLVELAWRRGELASTRVKYAVLRLRRKLGWEPEGSPLRTVRGFGYRYDPPPPA